MNRIYQGRVSGVTELLAGKKGNLPEDWKPLENWEDAMWRHHVLFQTATNYYTLCLAAMVGGMDDCFSASTIENARAAAAAGDPKHKTDATREKAVREAVDAARAKITAAKAWRDVVAATWVIGERRGKKLEGGHATVAPLLGLAVTKDAAGKPAFDDCAAEALAGSRATAHQQAAALLQLLEEADGGDLSILINDRLGWFCCPAGKNDKTAKSTTSAQEQKRQRIACEFRDLPDEQAIARASTLDLGVFLTTPPSEELVGKNAVVTLRKYWTKVQQSYPALAEETGRLDAIAPAPKKGKAAIGAVVEAVSEPLRIPALGRKPSGIYPAAAVFKFVPCVATLRAFRAATASLCNAKGKQVAEDPIADSRIEDSPHFAYFTNLAFHREGDAKQQAAWKEFDNAALVEAVKSPHRYFQDTQARQAAAAGLRAELLAMETEGRAGGADEDGAGRAALDGFAQDVRVERLVALLFSDLGHLGEVDTPEDDRLGRQFITDTLTRLNVKREANSREYTLRERTLRSWPAVRDAWRDLHAKGEDTQTALEEVVAKEQGGHRADFGSAPFYMTLAKAENHCIWRDKGTRDFHADDPISAWAEYTELRRELRDKERPIRFTPADAKESPRYFIFPKKAAAGGKWGSVHEPASGKMKDAPGMLAFTAGIAVRDGVKYRPVMTRITYRAPRLRRDEMRTDGEESLEAAPWLQPMVKALGLADSPVQDFGNCRIALQAHAFKDKEDVERYNIQLTFPVEIQAEKLIAQIGKQALWAKRFNLTPDGESFRESSLRRKHEKQPKEPPRPLEEVTQRFTFGSMDFGLHADAWAMHEVRLDGEFGEKASRAITTGEEAPWRLATRELKKLRLPGSDAMVWRKRSPKDRDDLPEFAMRQELYGDNGRKALPEETAGCFQLMCDLLGEQSAWEFVSREPKLPANVREAAAELLGEFSFPEQNDKLVVVCRRAQSRLARVARWRVGMGEEARSAGILKELRQACGIEGKDEKTPPTPGEQWIAPAIRDAASAQDAGAFLVALRAEHKAMIGALPPLLERIANRILPLRGRSWKWERVEDREKEGRLHGLEQCGAKIEDVWLQGQRGLSIMRIEQIEELRRRVQSFNQAERRHHAAEQIADGQWTAERAKQWVRRDFTDPCADLLGKLEELKTQRVNQSAHMILAQALGVRLAPPPADKKALREERDLHGVYEKFREPVDFIAIEDLSRYRASQGRAPQENGRLMKWCHRAVRDKLRELCEPFGIPVLEVPAAYSSQFCARSGVIGFRAAEETEGFEERAPWCFKLRVKDGENPTPEQLEMRALAADLRIAQKAMERRWKGTGTPPKVTVILPKQGGQIFVPIVASPAEGNRLAAKVGDADINAAVNIGLRAVADPRMWEFFPRLRTERVSGEVRYKGRKGKKAEQSKVGEIKLRAREKRKFGEAGPELKLSDLPGGSAARETRQPNYFRDFAGIAKWDKAWLASADGQTELVSAKSLFKEMRDLQWQRCQDINRARLMKQPEQPDEILM